MVRLSKTTYTWSFTEILQRIVGFSGYAFAVCILLAGIAGSQSNAQEIVFDARFGTPSDIKEWNIGELIKQKRAYERGTVQFSDDFGGSAKLSVSGAPGAIDYWTSLPIDLHHGDKLVIEYASDKLHPICGFDALIGPTVRYGHKMSIPISASGHRVVTIPVEIPNFVAGTPLGVHFSVWPGQCDINLIRVSILR